MAWIREIAPADAASPLREVYDEIVRSRGKVANILTVHSLAPPALKAHLDLYMAVMFERTGLSREDRELVAVAVSAANGCPYCVQHHTVALEQYWGDRDRVKRFAANPDAFGLPANQRVLVDHALKLTREPRRMSRADLEPLRAAGLGDEQILNLNLVVAYFNFVNRISLGLGVEFTVEEKKGYRY
jgi:uncharacterized peroxidase-related enzyme